jgi:hypothetical protein
MEKHCRICKLCEIVEVELEIRIGGHSHEDITLQAKTFYIYALIDPVTHLVRYVGRTTRPPTTRYRHHCAGHGATTGPWVRSLSAPPIFVLLEVGEVRRVAVGSLGHRGHQYTSSATVAETKWIKRFRRNLINRRLRDNCAQVWDALTNKETPGGPQDTSR